MPTYIGIDWSEQKHDVVFLNEAGAILAHQTIPHTLPGLQALDEMRQDLGLSQQECWVAQYEHSDLFAGDAECPHYKY